MIWSPLKKIFLDYKNLEIDMKLAGPKILATNDRSFSFIPSLNIHDPSDIK